MRAKASPDSGKFRGEFGDFGGIVRKRLRIFLKYLPCRIHRPVRSVSRFRLSQTRARRCSCAAFGPHSRSFRTAATICTGSGYAVREVHLPARAGHCVLMRNARKFTPPDPAERVVPPTSGAVSGGSCALSWSRASGVLRKRGARRWGQPIGYIRLPRRGGSGHRQGRDLRLRPHQRSRPATEIASTAKAWGRNDAVVTVHSLNRGNGNGQSISDSADTKPAAGPG